MPVSRVSYRYPGPREFVHIKILVSPVRFSHYNVRLLMVYHLYAKFACRAICRTNTSYGVKQSEAAIMQIGTGLPRPALRTLEAPEVAMQGKR